MSRKSLWAAIALLVVLSMIISACGGGATPAPAKPAAEPTAAPAAAEPTKAPEAAKPAEGGGLQIPDVVDGKFNVAAVLIGPHDDGGWSQAHYDGLTYIEKNMPDSHVAYVENVPEGAEAEQVIRSLARKGFDLILTTSFGYMDPTGAVAEEFPDQTFVHVSGFKSNSKNFGNLMGAMENMKYLAGMVAGFARQEGRRPEDRLHGDFPHPRRAAPGQCLCVGHEEDLPRMHDGRALAQHLARSGGREGSRGFAV